MEVPRKLRLARFDLSNSLFVSSFGILGLRIVPYEVDDLSRWVQRLVHAQVHGAAGARFDIDANTPPKKGKHSTFLRFRFNLELRSDIKVAKMSEMQ